jgi:hypothetical protein
MLMTTGLVLLIEPPFLQRSYCKYCSTTGLIAPEAACSERFAPIPSKRNETLCFAKIPN